MAVVVPAPPALSGDLTLFHTTDPLLANLPVLIFYGPAATIGSTSSRIQVHIFTSGGHATYPRLAISPNSPFYTAVSNLPREEQGDEVCRGLAFGLRKYFAELDDHVKSTWCAESKAASAAALFGDEHVAILATRMAKVENVEAVESVLQQSFREMRMSWIDVDVVLPPGSIKQQETAANASNASEMDEAQLLLQKYGKYAPLVQGLGDVAFLPTSKLKRAPSKATSIGRSASFMRHQKETVRKELRELLDTEISYVERIKELSNLADSLGSDLGPEAQAHLRSIVPPSIHEIVKLNGDLLDDLQRTYDDVEPEAVRDILAMPDDQPTAKQAHQDLVADSQGIGAITKCLCEWLPKFEQSYGEYLGSYAECSHRFRELTKCGDPSTTAALATVGEQKLTSLLIEPVQRLPRYTLYIDTITKQLPVRHPALKQLLRARDIVSAICDQDGPDTSTKAIHKLRSRVAEWPLIADVTGRLVTAADYLDVSPPYHLSDGGVRGILLLFTDCLVMLEKQGPAATNSRSLLTDFETGHLKPKVDTGRPGTPQGLRFLHHIPLGAASCLEGLDGSTVQIFTHVDDSHIVEKGSRTKVPSCMTLRLEGAYERKVERLAEELVKARVEGRFVEAERESSKWEVRASDPLSDAASLFSAIVEDSNPSHVDARPSVASVRLVVDIDRHSRKHRAGQHGIRTIICASPLRDGRWRLTFDSIDGNINQELVEVSEVLFTIQKRLTALTMAAFLISRSDMTGCLLARNAEILQAVEVTTSEYARELERQASLRERSSRPKSPKKFLTSFLSSTGPGQIPGLMKKDLPPLPPPSDPPRFTIVTNSKPPSRESRPSSRDQPMPKSFTSTLSVEQPSNPISRLEATLSTYVVALKARKGNIVGRSLKMRSTADELAVSELYNSLLEDPNMMTLAAQAPVDVLFVAFEKFLNIAWKERIGQVLPLALLQSIQLKAETLFPTDFDAYFKSTLETLAPQNHRAFKQIMHLLAELLDGTGNDSDRGTLTAAFAEVLVPEGNAHDYIALIDRFVDDPDTYFGEPLEEFQKTHENTGGMHKRAHSVNSASINSNTSSLRKKFGFGLSRDTNTEQESKVVSVWRTLSKSAKGDANAGNSVSKGSLRRAHSIDTEARRLPSRPTSQDGSIHKPSILVDNVPLATASSTGNVALSTIGEHPSLIPTQPPRKKRRSSLSDLRALDDSIQQSPLQSSPISRRFPVSVAKTEDKSLPASPPPSTPSSKAPSGRFVSPIKERPKLPSSFQKENSPIAAKMSSMTTRETGKPDTVVVTARSPSSIPTAKSRTGSPQKAPSPLPGRAGGLFERRDAGNAVKKLSLSTDEDMKPANPTLTTTGSPKKLRMQSPQKLRERLHLEQTALTAAHASLQDELNSIGTELTSLPGRANSVRSGVRLRQSEGTMELAARVLKMEGKLPQRMDELQSRIGSIHSDLSTSLAVSEAKCKKLDVLYREANDENEALYARFNDELGRILKAVRGGDGIDELKAKLKESQEEVTMLKRENGRLKRENVGLRSQLKE